MKFKVTLLLLFILFVVSAKAEGEDNKNKKIETAALELILSEKVQQLYHEMGDSARIQWAERFWRAMDPTPTTERNEYYEEFRQRLEFALEIYHNMVKPYYFDDRGKYYIKYGPPDDRVESAGYGKAYRNNITWAYYNLNLFIDFVEYEFYGYREVSDLTDAVQGVPLNERVRIASELYFDRTEISQQYMAFRNVENDIEYFQGMQEINQIKQIAVEEAPPSIYDFKHKAKPLSVRLASAVFRGDLNKTRIELYYSLPLRELIYQQKDAEIQQTHLIKNLIIYDSNYRPLVKRNEKITLNARVGMDLKNNSYISQHNEELQPGNYNIAFRFENSESGRLAILKSQLNVRDFASKNLAVSDIQFAHQIKYNPKANHLKPNDLQVVPYISTVIRKIRPIMVYFEIYNLTLDESNRSHFRVSYQITQTGEKRNIIFDTAAKIASSILGKPKPSATGTSYEGIGTMPFEQVYSSFDFSSSPNGKKRFLVKVTDLISGKETSVSSSFVLE